MITRRIRTRELGKISFIFLLLLSIIPTCIVGYVGIVNTRTILEELEADNEKGLLQTQISPIASKIEVYKELIKFTSQLPAAGEILGGGQELLGSIESRQQSLNRYSGVLKRAFLNYPEITDVRLYDINRTGILHVARSEKSRQPNHENLEYTIDEDLYRHLLQLELNQIQINTRLVEAEEQNLPGDQLVLDMLTPVFSNGEVIGFFICSLNVGILSLSYPDVEWVFRSGEFLVGQSSASAYEMYPELEQIFLSGLPGITHGKEYYAWIPLFTDATGTSLLWAGKKVAFANLDSYNRQSYRTIFITVFLLFFLILLLGRLLAGRINRYNNNLYRFFEKRLVEYDKEITLPLSGFTDIDHFLEKIIQVMDINSRMQDENSRLIEELKEALNNVKELKSLLPVCSSCKKVRDDDGYWENLDVYISKYTDTSISHSLCPECLKKLYPEYAERVKKNIDENGSPS